MNSEDLLRIEELFKKDPQDLTLEDARAIVKAVRETRARWEETQHSGHTDADILPREEAASDSGLGEAGER